MGATEAQPTPVEPEVEEATFDYDGSEWVARVVGRAGGPAPAAAPLLLLGFWEAEHPGGERLREALTVGRSLADLSVSRLRESLGRAHEPPPAADAPERKRRRRSEPSRRRGRRGR